jgi:hypothetical protein
MTKDLVAHAAFALGLALASPVLAADVAFQSGLEAPPTSCDLDDVYCDCCRSRGYWFAGAEATMLQTVVTTGGTITASFSDTTAPGVATAAFQDGDGLDSFAFGPRVWVGRQFNDRWGLVGRYWDISASSLDRPDENPAIPSSGTNFATIEQSDNARLFTADLEVIRSFDPWGWKIDASGGVRFAHVDAASDFLAFGVFTSGNFINLTLQNGFEFDGVGGTGALVGRRQIGDSPFSLILGGRFSYLGGFTDSFGRSDGTVASSPSAPLVGAATVRRDGAEATATISELQAGLQADYPLANLPASVFIRTTVEYQHWNIDGLPTGGAGFGGTIGELTTNSFASAGLGDAHLIGASLAVGINW